MDGPKHVQEDSWWHAITEFVKAGKLNQELGSFPSVEIINWAISPEVGFSSLDTWGGPIFA